LKDIDKIEAVQRRFTRGLPGLRELPYCTRLSRVGLDSLELRRLKTDLILTFKILHGLLAVDLPFFDLSPVTFTRGHPLKLVVSQSRLECRRGFFAVRVVPAWNSLPGEVVLAGTVRRFRLALNELSLTKFLKRPEFVSS
jgi:hypothetical protein